MWVTIQKDSDVMIMGEPGPKWASWSYKKAHLSGRFHSSIDGFDGFVEWVKTNPFCNEAMETYPQSRSLTVCLGLGLLLRDLHVIQFELGENGEGGVSGGLDPTIEHLKKSKLEWGHSKELLRLCDSIVRTLEICLDDGEQQQPQASGSQQKQPPSKRQKKQPDRYESLWFAFE
jgi:hypothetical protein